MMASDKALQADLIALASARTDDALWATASLLAAASVLLGQAMGDHEAGEAILATVRAAVSRARH
ncbi:hypothetical protein SAMN05192583_0567 [Sphingomonas gellani]|uniref:Uncharacterized protein n=1 Tax=Sphingomonas gellani TaxID=1166340 RepID=A0A1H7Z7G8_9SPHN|nr:hypothetical protein [Sphingomonas gellani]SEM54266.1 hypothetical protein SAMN05192583_0567 [Sphingomonas gellani]